MAVIKKEKVNSDDMPQRRPSRSKVYKSRMRLIFTLLLMVAVVIAAVLMAVFVFFKVSVVNISGSSIYSNEEILEKSGINVGDNLVLENGAAAEERICSALPYIESAKVTKKIPSTIDIELVDAEVYYCFQSGNEYLYVSRNKKLLETQSSAMAGSILVTGAEVSADKGRVVFTDSNAEAVFDEISAVFADNEKGLVSAIDLSNLYNIRISYDNRILMELGGSADLSDKLYFGLRVVTGEIGAEEHGTLDLSLARDANKAYFAPEVASSSASQPEGDTASSDEGGAEGDGTVGETSSEGETTEGESSAEGGENTETSDDTGGETAESSEESEVSSLRGGDIPDAPLGQ